MRIAIIGGGAAGLMTAATLLEHPSDHEILLIEKNPILGQKVMISGGGRCNVTTGYQDVKTVLAHYPRGNKFLLSAMHRFPPASVYAWFEQHGVPLKTEEDLRVFPQSDNGRDVVGVFEALFHASDRLRVLTKTAVTGVERQGERFLLRLKDHAEPLLVDALVLTTGGQAYRHTGSTGDGYAFAQALGHSLTPLAPSLNSFFTKETWVKDISGMSFERATITAKRDKDFARTGPFMFTHKGITGPAVFALSGMIAFESYDVQAPLNITLDLLPDTSYEQLLQQFEHLRREHGKKAPDNVLALLIPKALALLVCHLCKINIDQHAADLRKDELQAMCRWIKATPLTVIGRGAGDEFVTAGGIPLNEVNPSTMESTLCPGLFFAGEILDIDGFTGGFNLQASWATGRLAGSTLAER